MIKKGVIIGLLLLLMVACQPESIPTPTLAPTETADFTIDKTHISLMMLPGWRAYTDEAHIILARQSAPDEVSDVVVTIWQPNLDLTDDSLITALSTITTRLRRDNQTVTSNPVPFQWAGHDAAHYVIDTGDDTVTLIMALRLADDQIVAINVNGVDRELSFVQETLPRLFAQFRVQDQLVGNTDLLTLSQVINVPQLNPEAAIQASPDP